MQNYQGAYQVEKTEQSLISIEINANLRLSMKKILRIAASARGSQ